MVNCYCSFSFTLGGNNQLVSELNLRRMDTRENSLEATYFIDLKNSDDLSALTEERQVSFSGIGITFIDQNQMPSI